MKNPDFPLRNCNRTYKFSGFSKKGQNYCRKNKKNGKKRKIRKMGRKRSFVKNTRKRYSSYRKGLILSGVFNVNTEKKNSFMRNAGLWSAKWFFRI
jgi:mevalonate pyrophosphate decarboxylase